MAQAMASSAGPAQDPPNTRRVRGNGWSLAIPAHWDEGRSEDGNPRWTTPVGPGSTNQWTLGVAVVREEATLDQLVASLPGQFRLRSGTTDAPRRFTHKGRPAAELIVHFPGTTTQSRIYAAVMAEHGHYFLAMCSGPNAEVAPTCQTMLNSAFVGRGSDDRPSRAAAAGTRWFGRSGRYIQVPSSWDQEHEDAEHHTFGTADAADTHAAAVVIFDDLPNPPAEVIDGIVHSFDEDAANSVIRRTPFRRGGRSGVFVEATRAEVTTPAATLQQWVIPAGPERFYTLVCGAPTDSFASSPDTCREVFRTFGYENTQ